METFTREESSAALSEGKRGRRRTNLAGGRVLVERMRICSVLQIRLSLISLFAGKEKGKLKACRPFPSQHDEIL